MSELLLPTEIAKSKIGLDTPIASLARDTAQVRPGSLFFALQGSQADGHAFIPEALAKGAAAVVVEKEDAFAASDRAILVRSTRECLAWAAARWHGEPSKAFRLVGVTGTNGKTTSTYLLRSIWDAFGFTSGVLGTVEYHIGRTREASTLTTPDPLGLQALFARLRDAGAQYTALEVSSIALDQWRVGGSRFAVGLFTNLTQDHLDYHGDMERYYQAKLKLFTEYDLPAAVINLDDPWGERLVKESRARRNFSYSVLGKSADLSVTHATFHKGGTRATLQTPVGALDVESPLIGRHNLSNVVGVLGTALALGLDLRASAAALKDAVGAPGRLERVRLGEGKPHVFVDYAHSDDALRNVLRSLAELANEGTGSGRIITVFGAGGDRDRGKRPKMAQVVSSLSHVTVATSDNPRTEDPERILDEIEAGIDRGRTRYFREVDRRKAIALALSFAGPEDLVLVAGKGHENYQILGREKVPFDDRLVVRHYYGEK